MKTTIISKVIIAFGFSLLLVACSNPNPLDEKPVIEAGKLLANASAKSSVVIGLSPVQAGDNYRQCMLGKLNKKTCTKLYKAMSKELGKEGVKVSVAQVSDTNMFKNVSAQLHTLSYLME